MKLVMKSISSGLPPALKAYRPAKMDVEQFILNLCNYLDHIDGQESEENLKTHLMGFLKPTYAPGHTIEQLGAIDFVIRTGGKGTPAAVLFEAKREANKPDMIRADDVNRKAMHELVLYFMQQRDSGNTDIQHLVICTEHELYILKSLVFERNFYKNTAFRKDFEAWRDGKKTEATTDFFYREIAARFIGNSNVDLESIYVDLNSYKPKLQEGSENKELIKLFKLLGPHYLIRKELANDSNSLNKAFYDELLHVIGLEERKEGSKRVIGRLEKAKRNPGTLLENAIGQIRYENEFHSQAMILEYGSSNEEREFNIALELCLTWVNRLLFLKLLEAQILKFHGQDSSYKFLAKPMIADFDDLSDLFFKVLAFTADDRPDVIRQKYAKVPYLNSSLFERTKLEGTFRINSLNNGLELPIFKNTVLKDNSGRRTKGDKNTLAYIFEFLDSYDFGTVGGGDVQEESKTIINAAVLGLIFEKINGYREGAIFTPGYVTMYMARKVIEKTVLEAFQRENLKWTLNDVDDLKNNITDRSKASILKLNSVIDGLKICDPAVGSGHFLVSCLNELIALKSRLGILADAEGNRLSDYQIEVDNDELIIVHENTDEVFAYQISGGTVSKALQHVQQTLFHEKQKLIENCLFGVDINANSVRICQLRLWIELLKSAYYRDGKDNQLETLPNIDINIKCGNSLLSRFKLDQNLSDAFNKAGLTVGQYRKLVNDYKNTKDKAIKRSLIVQIEKAKTKFQEESLRRLTKELDATLASLRADEVQTDLFLLENEQRKEQEAKLEDIRRKIADLEAKREKLLQNKTFLSALEWRFEFPEVLDEKGRFVGFDIIIANPPYMRVQEIEATQSVQREFYERDFRTARGSYDLANLFFELAVRLSRTEDSNNIFIFPHKLFNSANGAPLREYLMNTCAMKHITHFGANKVFDSATTYTCIALFNSNPAGTIRFKRFALGDNFEEELDNETSYSDLRYDAISSASKLYGSNQWIFFNDPKGFGVFEKIYQQASLVGREIEAFVGVQTSRDSLYIAELIEELENGLIKIRINPKGSKNPPVPTTERIVESDLFKRFIVGKDTQRYRSLETTKVVFFPYDPSGFLVPSEKLKSTYPKTYEFLTSYQKEFSSRESGKAKKLAEWYAFIYPKNLTKFQQRKLTCMDICSSHPNVAIDEDHLYHGDTAYSYVPTKDGEKPLEVYAAILNSRLFWWFLKHTGDTLQGDARRMKTSYIDPFPLPAAVKTKTQCAITSLVRELVAEKANDACTSEIDRLESEINDEVYALYGLSDDEITVIERAI